VGRGGGGAGVGFDCCVLNGSSLVQLLLAALRNDIRKVVYQVPPVRPARAADGAQAAYFAHGFLAFHAQVDARFARMCGASARNCICRRVQRRALHVVGGGAAVSRLRPAPALAAASQASLPSTAALSLLSSFMQARLCRFVAM
jgi:hypothetical protein